MGLSRWGVVVEVRAAVAAADHATSGMDAVGADGECIRRARQWVICRCEPHRMEWVEAWRLTWHTGLGPFPIWIPCPPNADGSWAPGPSPVHTISACARAHGEAPVREAIQRALVSWALGEEP